MPQLCGMILQDPPRPLQGLRPDLPQALQHVVLRCLEKNREQRFNNVAELAHALAPFGRHAAQRSAERISRVLGAAGFPSAPPAVAVAASSLPGAGTTSNFGASTEANKSRIPLVAALCLAGLLLGGTVLFLTRKTPALESVAELPSASPVAAAPPPSVQPSPPAVEPQTPAPSASAVASAASAPSSAASVVAKTKLKTKVPTTNKGKAPPPQPAAPTIDPLDGRR